MFRKGYDMVELPWDFGTAQEGGRRGETGECERGRAGSLTFRPWSGYGMRGGQLGGQARVRKHQRRAQSSRREAAAPPLRDTALERPAEPVTAFSGLDSFPLPLASSASRLA